MSTTEAVPLSVPLPELAINFRVMMRLEGVPVASRRKFRRRGKCAKCGTTTGSMTVDHIVPRCRLRHLPSIMNHPLNKQTLCQPCNNQKGNGKAIDYREDIGRFEGLVRLMRRHGVREEILMAVDGALCQALPDIEAA